MKEVFIIIFFSTLFANVFSQENAFETCHTRVRVIFKNDNTTDSNLVVLYIVNKVKEKIRFQNKIQTRWVEGSGYLYIDFGGDSTANTKTDNGSYIDIERGEEKMIQTKIKNVNKVIYTVTLTGDYDLVKSMHISDYSKKGYSNKFNDEFFYGMDQKKILYRYDINWYYVKNK